MSLFFLFDSLEKWFFRWRLKQSGDWTWLTVFEGKKFILYAIENDVVRQALIEIIQGMKSKIITPREARGTREYWEIKEGGTEKGCTFYTMSCFKDGRGTGQRTFPYSVPTRRGVMIAFGKILREILMESKKISA